MEISEILNGTYNKIYHISDIHIRNTIYHQEEYMYVFNELYTYIQETKTDNSLIVICGDILHNEQINNTSEILCIDFFDNLNKLLPTIIIAGNHDFYVNTESDHDSLHTILYKRQKELTNIYYLRESGIYKCGNIYFAVSSLINNKENIFIHSKDLPDDGNIKISLYHGPIINSKTNSGFLLEGTKVKKFKNYDYVLLGDIHKYQYLDDTQTIAYASSLISQNFSEVDNYHGVLVWNLLNKTSIYKTLDNPFRHIEIKINNNKIYYDSKKVQLDNLIIPEKAKIKFKIINSNINFINNVKNFIKNKFPNTEIKHEKKELEEIITDNVKHEDIFKDNTIYTNEMIEHELDKIDELYRKDVKTVLNSELKKHTNHLNGKKIWKLLKLEFSNLLTYGENNVFDFEKLDNYEITGLCGQNSIGKSSLIDIILIALFNDYSRNDTTKRSKHKHGINISIVNHNFKSFKTKVTFQVGQNIYYIIKEGIVKDKNNTLHFNKYDLVHVNNNSEKVISCGITHKENTLKHIEELIGSYSDFCVSSLSFQSNVNHNFDFYKMSSYQRKKFLNEHFNLEYFDEIKKKYTKFLSETKLKMASIKGKIDINNFSEEDLNTIITIKDQLIITKNNFDNLKSHNDQLKSQKDNLQFIHINNTFSENDIELFESNKNELLKIIHNYKFKIDKLNLINSKDKIIEKNIIFENNKKDKIEKLLFQIKNNDCTINFSKYNKKELTEFINIFTNLLVNTKKLIPASIIDVNHTLINNLLSLNNKLSNQKNECGDDIYILSEEDIQYYNSYTFSYNKYQYYNKLYQTYIDNKNIFELLSNIHNNCNKECSNCLKTNNIITQYINTNNLEFDFNINKIIHKYNKYNRLHKIHKIYELKKYNDYLEFIDIIKKDYNNQLVNFNKTHNYYTNELYVLENIIIHIQNTIIKLDIQEIQSSLYSDYILLQKQINIYNDLQTKIININKELNEINNNINLFYTYKNISDTNETNRILFEQLSSQININDQTIFSYNNNLITLQLQLDKLTSAKTIYEDLISQFNNLDKDKHIFTHINKLVDSNGLPLKIIQNKLLYIQNGVSNMLYKIIKKKILITEDITNIYIDIVNDNGLVSSYFGGMEFFICTLCFKILLCSILNIPFSGILFIDEGVSALDKEHIDNFNIVIDFLKEYYSKVLLITHIKDFKNFTNTNINIKSIKHSNHKYVSHINFL
jgi:DNA repair exonuclease SbcCD ATPase subunit